MESGEVYTLRPRERRGRNAEPMAPASPRRHRLRGFLAGPPGKVDLQHLLDVERQHHHQNGHDPHRHAAHAAFDAPAIAGRHDVKAYGKAEAGSPPMSVPHLDARKLDGKPVVLFGPFTLFSTKFLKDGSWFDLFSSVNNHNVGAAWCR